MMLDGTEQERADSLVADLRRAGISEEDIRNLWIPDHLTIPPMEG